MGDGALLLDLGNRRLKRATTSDGVRLDALEVVSLPSAGAWASLEDRVGDWARDSSEVRVCSSNPAALQRLRRGPLRTAHPLRVFDADGQDWPLRVTSRGTGADRVLGAFAAWRRGEGAVVVADCGTAWTLDAVDAAGGFRGGAIGPGLGISVAALNDHCPHLDAPSPEPFAAVPEDTASAVAAGTRGALAAALEGLASRFEEALGEPARRYVTGGDRAALAPLLGATWEAADHLVLEGLAALGAPRGAPW